MSLKEVQFLVRKLHEVLVCIVGRQMFDVISVDVGLVIILQEQVVQYSNRDAERVLARASYLLPAVSINDQVSRL